jgi:hypothetical protein
MTFWTWEWILQEVQKLDRLSTRLRENIYPGTPLPHQYTQKLGCLEALLVSLATRVWHYIASIFPLRPGFRQKFDVKYEQQLETMSY